MDYGNAVLRKRFFAVSASFSFLTWLCISGCAPTRISVPSAAQDKAPVITVHAVASGGSGQIEKPEMTSANCPSPCVSYVTEGTDLLTTVDAKNPAGGVKSLDVKITESSTGSPLLSVRTSAVPDSNGKVPTSLAIVGHNGAGGIGGEPLRTLMPPKPEWPVVAVAVSASNFNNMTSDYRAVYSVLKPIDINLTADKTVVNQGEPVVLHWTTLNASPPVYINQVGYAEAYGLATVWPTPPWTRYTLTAMNFIYQNCQLPDKSQCQGAELKRQSLSVTVNPAPTPQPEPTKPQTQRIELQGQPMGLGGFRPYRYVFGGTVHLSEIALPNGGNPWVAAIKLPKMGYSTADCGNPSRYVLLETDSHTTPSQLKDLYGEEIPTFSAGGWIAACVSPKQGMNEQESVGVLITYTH